ncbi:MAG: ankyrin repeat domain-containing protein [Treponemataceae bacterium]|nr:ankyrin repeat domain-containing protein [Treponemataceae bacterium]
MEKALEETSREKDNAGQAHTFYVDIDGWEYVYFMTNNFSDVIKILKIMGYCAPIPQDWRWNPSLHQNVRNKMVESGTKYSLTMSHNVAVLNSYTPNSRPFIVYLSDLRRQKSDDVQALVKSLNMPPKNMPPLLYACAVGNIEGVRIFIEHKVDVNVQDENGFTALMFASALNQKEIVQLLLQNGADMSLRSNSGYYALLYAIFSDAQDAVKVLEDAGATLLSFSFNPTIDKNSVPFNEKLKYYVLNDVEYKYGKKKGFAFIYRRGNISRQTFSKIWSAKDSDFRPKKNTVIQLAIGLRLTIVQTKDLLESAGYFLMPNDTFDSIVTDFISRLDYDIDKIDNKLFEETGRTLSLYESCVHAGVESEDSSRRCRS